MHVITVATTRNKLSDHWERSLQQWGVEYTILGEGRKWEGFQTYTKVLIDYLEKCPADRLLVNTDCYDVVFAGPAEELVEKFVLFQKRIVVGGEGVCFLNCFRHSQWVNHPKYRWVNGGFVMGRASDLLKLYKFVYKTSPGDDQVGIAMYLQQYAEEIAVDGKQALVANIRSHTDLKRVENGRFRHSATGSSPVVIHIPFIYADLGRRCEMVKLHTLQEYQTTSTWEYTKGFVGHLHKHVRNNPRYRIFAVCAVIGCVVVVLAVASFIYTIKMRYN
jgi:hypothetical protein